MRQPTCCLAEEAKPVIRMLAAGTPPGVFVEIGVHEGGSALLLADLGRPQLLFDLFKVEEKLEIVRHHMPDADIYRGEFPDSMPPSMPPIAFCFYDAGDVTGVEACIKTLWPKMVDGGIMMFSYVYHPDHLPPRSKILQAHFAKDDIKFATGDKWYDYPYPYVIRC